IFGAVAVGLFHRAELGIIITTSHYAGNILVGFVMRFYGSEEEQTPKMSLIPSTKRNIIHRAFQHMHQTRLQKKQPIGEIIGESVTTSVQTLLLIGEYIILFSVFTSMIQVMHITFFIQSIFAPLFITLKLSNDLMPAIFTGLFEITLGSDLISEIKEASTSIQLVAVSFILGFNGFS